MSTEHHFHITKKDHLKAIVNLLSDDKWEDPSDFQVRFTDTGGVLLTVKECSISLSKSIMDIIESRTWMET